MDSYQPFSINGHRKSRIPMWLQFIVSIIAAGGLALVLNMFVFQSFYVDGESMSPTLHSSDRLIISKLENTYAKLRREPYVPQRGQIVIVDGNVSPSTAVSAPHLIKRVVAIPGDRLVIRGGTATLYSAEYKNGINLDELLGLSLDTTFSSTPIDVTIRDGSVFVMGDNRKAGGSYDSRSFGSVDTDLIIGRLWARILPLDQRRVF